MQTQMVTHNAIQYIIMYFRSASQLWFNTLKDVNVRIV